MKTIKKYAALFCALCTILAVTGCDNNLFEPSQPAKLAGKNALVLNISNGSPAGRTIAPKLDRTGFDKYEIEVFHHNETTNPVYEGELEGTHTTIIELREGAYDVYVKGYNDSKLIAEGKHPNVTLANGYPTEINIELVPVMTAGNGTFSWDLTFDASITAASMQIVNGSTHANVGDAVNVKTTAEGTNNTLAAGEYDVVFTLTFGSQVVVWTERLHIYRDLESVFEFHFDDLRTESLAQRIENLIKENDPDNILVHGINEQHFELLGIHGVDSLNIEPLCETIEWVSSLAASVDIALIRLHNFENLYHGEEALKTAISALPKNGTTITGITISGDKTTVSIAGTSIEITGYTISAATITGISVTGGQLVYFQHYSTTVNFTEQQNFAVTATLSYGDPATLDSSAYTITSATINFATTGTVKITVTLNENTTIKDEFDIEIVALDSITLDSTAVPKNYYQFIPATVSLSELTVTGHWGDTPHILNANEYTHGNLELNVAAAGTPKIEIDYHGKKADIDVTVHALNSIKLKGADELAEAPFPAAIKGLLTGGDIEVVGTYANSTTHVLNDYINFDEATITVVPEDIVLGNPADYTVTFTWKTFTCNEYSFTYNDKTPIVTGISVSGDLGKFYQFISAFSRTGVVVTAHYSHGGADAVVTTASFDSKEYSNTTAGAKKIYVEYQGHHAEYEVTIIKLEGIEVEGLISQGDDANLADLDEDPTADEILTMITSVKAVYEGGEHKENITASITAANIEINDTDKVIIVRWHNTDEAFTSFPYTIADDE
ncbi:MAG: bacterial Ig-like domain-containing protein [Treponema sp.]|nr:bacterial Ig-like domain-containing protein [Treponema sp.]